MVRTSRSLMSSGASNWIRLPSQTRPAARQYGISEHRGDERARLHAAFLAKALQQGVDGLRGGGSGRGREVIQSWLDVSDEATAHFGFEPH